MMYCKGPMRSNQRSKKASDDDINQKIVDVLISHEVRTLEYASFLFSTLAMFFSLVDSKYPERSIKSVAILHGWVSSLCCKWSIIVFQQLVDDN